MLPPRQDTPDSDADDVELQSLAAARHARRRFRRHGRCRDMLRLSQQQRTDLRHFVNVSGHALVGLVLILGILMFLYGLALAVTSEFKYSSTRPALNATHPVSYENNRTTWL